jgi:DNA recombination protein RmuC
MTINIIALVVSLISLGILFFVLIRLRDNSQLTESKTDKIEEKINSFSDGMGKIIQELASVTTPINELNRFLGGNVTTGRLGEWSLESIVQDIMPDGSYHFQHIINPQTSEQVDCAVLTADGVKIPIDSKFYPGLYKNYQNSKTDTERNTVLRDLRKAVLNDATDISDKYILQNTTTNYVVLYVASEKLIDLIDRIDGLRQECLTEKKVLIQGPNTLAAFLDHVRVGHHYLKLNETAEKVAQVVRNIQIEFNKFDNSTGNVEKKLESSLKEISSLKTRINVLGKTLDRGAESLEDLEDSDESP